MTKRLVAVFFAIVFCVSTLSVVSYSENNSVSLSYQQNFDSPDRSLELFYSFIGSELGSFVDTVLEGVAIGDISIDIQRFKIPAIVNMMEGIEQFIWKELPAAFNVNQMNFGIRDTAGGSFVVYVYVSYYFDSQTYVDMLSDCEDVAEKLLWGIKDNDSLTQVEKAILIHDRIADLCEYDFEFGPNCYNMYGVLVQKIAVCEGYTMAYKYLLDQVGIQSYYCSSTQLDHAWNILILDGEAYHVDITWDDPASDIPGIVHHHNFLRSTEGFVETEHIATDYDQTPVSTRYDRAFWQNSTSSFQLIGVDVYFLDNSNEYLCKVTENGNEHILSVEDTWSTIGGYYEGNFSTLSSSCKTLLYSLSDAVYSYCVKTGQSQLVFKPALAPGEAIYGMKYDGERISCYIGTYPYDVSRTEMKPYSIPEEEHTFENAYDSLCDVCGESRELKFQGDLNRDNVVNSDDAIYLLYSTLLGEERYPRNQNCDFDKDGNTDSDDAIYLLYHTLLGSERYPIS